MQSFLIVSKDPKKQDEYVFNLCKQHSIDALDKTVVEQFGETLGISEIRALQKSLFLKPFKSAAKAAILKNAQTLTIAAQNALLKILEEPPNNTLIILATDQKYALLPTVLSRCVIIELDDTREKETAIDLDPLLSLLESGIGKKLKLAERLSKDKKETIAWLEKMITTLRKKLINDILENKNHHVISQYPNILISLQRTHTILKTTNVNPRFALENLFLSII